MGPFILHQASLKYKTILEKKRVHLPSKLNLSKKTSPSTKPKEKKVSTSSPIRKPVKKGKVYYLVTKKAIVSWHIENGLSQGDLAKHFTITPTCLGQCLMDSNLMQNVAAARGGKVQRIRQAQHPELKVALFHWVIEAHTHRISIEGQVLQEKAMRFGKLLKICIEFWNGCLTNSRRNTISTRWRFKAKLHLLMLQMQLKIQKSLWRWPRDTNFVISTMRMKLDCYTGKFQILHDYLNISVMIFSLISMPPRKTLAHQKNPV